MLPDIVQDTETYTRVARATQYFAEGLTETQACVKANISVGRLRRVLRQNDELAAGWAEAQDIGIDAMVDATLDIDRLISLACGNVSLAKLYSDNIQWAATRRARRKFGDRLDMKVEHNLTADKAVLDALAAGKERALSAPRPTEDAVVIPSIDEFL